MRKLLIVLMLGLCARFAFSQSIAVEPDEMFPLVSLVEPLAHFAGDQATYSTTLYAMRNANAYFAAYEALVAYHNEVALAARDLVEINHKQAIQIKEHKFDLVCAKTTGGIVGFGIGVGVASVVSILLLGGN